MSLQEQAPVESGNVIISKSLDYKIQASSVPVYKKHLITPSSGSTEVTLSADSTIETIIELPAGRAYNLSESILYGGYQMPPPGAANRYSWMPQDHFPKIKDLQLYTRSGTYLCNIQDLAKYLKLRQKVSMNTEDFLNRNEVDYFYPSNELTSDLKITATTPNLKDSTGADLKNGGANITGSLPITVAGSANGLLSSTVNSRFDGTASKFNFIEHKYCKRSAISTNGTDGKLVGNFQFRLGDIPDSIFSIDKDLYFNEVIVLRIVWEQYNKYLWYGTDATNPSTGAANIANVAAPDNAKITNLSLYLAVEMDNDIVQGLRAKVNSSGLQVLTPYPWYFKNNLQTAGNHNITLRFNSAHGMSLSKVFTAPFNNSETLGTTCNDHDNKDTGTALAPNNKRVKSYYTMIDNSRTTEFDVTCTNTDARDYMLHKDILKGTPIADLDVYRYNWFIMDDFSKDKEVGNDPNTVNGLPLTAQERKWDIQATMNGNISANWYSFAITQRRLLIGPQMIEIK